MSQPKLFMVLIGCTPAQRHTEQHDVFFSVAESLKDLRQEIIDFWPEGEVHIDAWREVTYVDGYSISILPANQNHQEEKTEKLFFINLGGYKQNEFEEFHYKMLAVGKDKGEAMQQSKRTIFYKHTGFKGAESHVDDKYGVDVDDVYKIEDILPDAIKKKYRIEIKNTATGKEDEMHLGYLMMHKLESWF